MATSLPTYTGDTTALVQPTGDAVVDSIIVASKWGTGPAGTGASLTYAFPAALSAFDTRDGVAGNYNENEATQGGYAAYLKGFSAFGAEAQTAARETLAAWAAVTNLSFQEVPASSVDAGVLRFAMTAPPGIGATTYGVSSFPQDFAGAGDTWMNAKLLFPEGWAQGTQNFLTLLHEVGHALGLKHPHDTGMNGTAGWPATPSVLDKTGTDTLVAYSTQNLVMAYNDLPGVGAPVQADFAPTTPMQIDIKAIQYLYGPNLSHNAGNTTYTYRSDAKYNETLWDGGGIDTIRVEGDTAATISLVPATWSHLGLPLTYAERDSDTLAVAKPRPDLTDPRTVFIFDTVTIENAVGGGGNDTLIGNAVANRLQGGGGNDQINGGAGIDTAVFSVARAAATWTAAEASLTVNAGADGSDTLVNVERLRFADVAVALDTGTTGHAGQTAQILRALFGASALANPTFAGIGINLFDAGQSYADIVALAIGTPVFEQLAGSRSNTDFVQLVYKNVIGTAPGAAELATFVGMLDSGSVTQAALGVMAAQVAFNTQSTELVGLASTGLDFVPVGG